MQMTGDQFDALVKLMRGTPESPANRAGRLVLVDGLTQADAMRESGVTRATVNHAVKRYSDADSLIRSVYSVK